MEYRRHEQPGCGCFLPVFLLGGFLLFSFPNLFVFIALFLLFSGMVAFFAIVYFIKRQMSAYVESQTEDHNTFVFLLVNILVKVAQIDGTVTKDEIKTIRHFFQYNLHYSQSQLYWVKELIKEALASTVSIESLLQEFRQKFAYEPRLMLLELIYQVLYSNEKVLDSELQLVRNIGEYLGISAYEQRSTEAKYKAGYRGGGAPAGETGEDKYYAILGLSPGADFSEIKSAYRKLSMQYHPDKVAHLGEEFRKVGEEKMKEINNAYEYLKRKFAQ